MYWDTVTSAFKCQNIGINAFINGGNAFGAAASLGTTDANSLSFNTNGTSRVTVDSTGSVGIGTASPAATLDVRGVIVSAPRSSSAQCINFSNGNVQISSYSSTNTINVGGLVDGAAYTLVLTGYTSGQTVTVNGFTDTGCTTGVTYGVDFGGSNGGVVSSFTALGNTQLLTLIYSASRGVVYASAETNFYK
jgi:hypothetical protein